MKQATLEKLKLWVSPITRVIYIGTTKKNDSGKELVVNKLAVTDQVLAVAAEHLHETSTVVEYPHGTLMFEPRVAPKLLDGVKLTADVTEAGRTFTAGMMGTVVEVYEDGECMAEMVDYEGKFVGTVDLKTGQFTVIPQPDGFLLTASDVESLKNVLEEEFREYTHYNFGGSFEKGLHERLVKWLNLRAEK